MEEVEGQEGEVQQENKLALCKFLGLVENNWFLWCMWDTKLFKNMLN